MNGLGGGVGSENLSLHRKEKAQKKKMTVQKIQKKKDEINGIATPIVIKKNLHFFLHFFFFCGT